MKLRPKDLVTGTLPTDYLKDPPPSVNLKKNKNTLPDTVVIMVACTGSHPQNQFTFQKVALIGLSRSQKMQPGTLRQRGDVLGVMGEQEEVLVDMIDIHCT